MRPAKNTIPSRLTGGMPKEKTVLKALRQIQTQINALCDEAEIAIPPTVESVIADAIVDFLAEHCRAPNLKPRTEADYRDTLGKLSTFAGGMTFAQFGRSGVLDFLAEQSRGTWARHGSAIWSFFNWWDTYRQPGVAAFLPRKKPKAKKRTLALSDDEYELLWSAVEFAESQGWIWPRMADALRIGIRNPLRRGELIRLLHTEIDLPHLMINLGDSKTGARSLLIDSDSAKILARQPKAGKYVFPGRDGRPHIEANALNRALSKVIKRTGCIERKGVCFHALRHSWASRAARRGLHPEYIRQQMGHSKGYMTAQYTHVNRAELRKAVALVFDSLGGEHGNS